EEEILDEATAAGTITELKAEIETLKRLETMAFAVRRSGTDTKWRELASLLNEIFTPTSLTPNATDESEVENTSGKLPIAPSPRQKLVVFTEHRDTLSY